MARDPAIWVETFNFGGDALANNSWHDWYDARILEPRLRVPGVIAGRRASRLEGSVDEIACYDLTDLGVLESPEWSAIDVSVATDTSPYADFYRAGQRAPYRQIRTSIQGRYSPAIDAGVLHVATFEVDPEHQPDFHAWYDDEHTAFTISVPGYFNSRRFQGVDDSSRFLGLYDVATAGAPKLKETFELDNSPWSITVRGKVRYREKRLFAVDRLELGRL